MSAIRHIHDPLLLPLA